MNAVFEQIRERISGITAVASVAAGIRPPLSESTPGELTRNLTIEGRPAEDSEQRTHEIGIRMALGATKRDVLRLVIARGLLLVALGVAIGLAGSPPLTRLLRSLLWGVTPTDPLTYVVVIIALVTVALLACYLPARRALDIEPTIALRYE